MCIRMFFYVRTYAIVCFNAIIGAYTCDICSFICVPACGMCLRKSRSDVQSCFVFNKNQMLLSNMFICAIACLVFFCRYESCV